MALIPCKKAQCQRRIETLTYNRSLLYDRIFQVQRAQAAAAETSDRFTPVEPGISPTSDASESPVPTADSLPQVVIAISPLPDRDILSAYSPMVRSASPVAVEKEQKLPPEHLDLCTDMLDHRVARISTASEADSSDATNGWHKADDGCEATTSFESDSQPEIDLLKCPSLITFESLKRSYRLNNEVAVFFLLISLFSHFFIYDLSSRLLNAWLSRLIPNLRNLSSSCRRKRKNWLATKYSTDIVNNLYSVHVLSTLSAG